MAVEPPVFIHERIKMRELYALCYKRWIVGIRGYYDYFIYESQRLSAKAATATIVLYDIHPCSQP